MTWLAILGHPVFVELQHQLRSQPLDEGLLTRQGVAEGAGYGAEEVGAGVGSS